MLSSDPCYTYAWIMHNFFFWLGVGFLSGIIGASFFEWTLHRFFMHRPSLGFRYPFEKHALIHHHIFRADHSYHLENEKDKMTIPMAWWNGPVLVLVASIPYFVFSFLTEKWGVWGGSGLAIGLYYVAYEYMHWCMHLPKKRAIERSGIFFRLNGHHLLHHRYMHKNFNVVMPLADLLLGTLLTRSKTRFAQARGAAVPDVQPK